MMRRATIWLSALALVVVTLTIATPAMAEEDTISVQVRAIAAGIQEESFDPALEDLRTRLERGFRDYTSFEELSRHSHTITIDDSREFELPTDDVLALSFRGRDDELVKLGLTLGDRLDTSLRVSQGSTFFQAGLRYERRMLVLAITVK